KDVPTFAWGSESTRTNVIVGIFSGERPASRLRSEIAPHRRRETCPSKRSVFRPVAGKRNGFARRPAGRRTCGDSERNRGWEGARERARGPADGSGVAS